MPWNIPFKIQHEWFKNMLQHFQFKVNFQQMEGQVEICLVLPWFNELTYKMLHSKLLIVLYNLCGN